MEVDYTLEAQEDIRSWKNLGDQKILNKISSLVYAIQNSPFTGIGRPKPLKHHLSGLWSRRINREHRIIYEVCDENIIIYSLRGHYKEGG